MNRDPCIHQGLASLIEVGNREREVSKAASLRVGGLVVPVVGEFDFGLSLLGSEEHEGKAPALRRFAASLDQSEFIAKEVQCFVEVGDANHGVQVLHCLYVLAEAQLVYWAVKLRGKEGDNFVSPRG